MTYTRFKKELRSFSLDREDVKEFERILIKGSKVKNFEVSIRYGDFEIKKNSLTAFLDEIGLPDVVTSLRIYLFTDSGSISIQTFWNYIFLEIEGEKSWVINKKEEILNFLNNKKTWNFIIHNSDTKFILELVEIMLAVIGIAFISNHIHLGYFIIASAVFIHWIFNKKIVRWYPILELKLKEKKRSSWHDIVVAIVGGLLLTIILWTIRYILKISKIPV